MNEAVANSFNSLAKKISRSVEMAENAGEFPRTTAAARFEGGLKREL
jgi:hypothetical protein